MVDTSLYGKLKTLPQYQQENLQQQIAIDTQRQNQMMKLRELQLQEQKQSQLNVGELGEQAFMKKAMGQPLSPQEEAAMRYVDAKSGGLQFDPVTGMGIQKPSISQRMFRTQQDQAPGVPTPAQDTGIPQDQGFYSEGLQRALAAAKGNPRMQQSIISEYAKKQIFPSDAQTLAAGFADRVMDSERTFSDPNILAE